MSADTIQIISQDGTITITSGNYSIWGEGYAPNVHKLKPSAIGGLIMGDVGDAFDVLISADSKTNARAALFDLIMAFDYADRWWHGDSTASVASRIKWINNDSGDTYEAVIKGVGDGTDTPQEWALLPARYRTDSDDWVIGPVSVAFRRGPWVMPQENDSSITPSFDTPYTVHTVAWSDSIKQYGVAELQFQGNADPFSDPVSIAQPYIAYSNDSDGIRYEEGENFLGTGIASNAQTDARGGNVGRITPTTTAKFTYNRVLLGTSGVWDANQFYAFVRMSPQLSQTFTVNFRFFGTANNVTETGDIAVDASTSQYLGLFSLPGDLEQIQIEVTADVASTYLDIDWLCFVRADNPAQGVLQILNTNSHIGGVRMFSNLNGPSKNAVVQSNEVGPINYRGSGYIYTVGSNMYFSLLTATSINSDLYPDLLWDAWRYPLKMAPI